MSAFTAEEVEQLRSKGNLYCQKVWLGLHQDPAGKNRKMETDEAIKDFIIEKYERKRYYVDPSTVAVPINNTGSTETSVATTTTQQQNKTSGLIGSTLNARLQQQQQQQQQNSISISRPPVTGAQQTSPNIASRYTLVRTRVWLKWDVQFGAIAFRPSPKTSTSSTLLADLPFPGQTQQEDKKEGSATGDNNFANFETATFDVPPVGKNSGTVNLTYS